MIDDYVLEAILLRLSHALAAPTRAYLPLAVDGVTCGWLTPERAARLHALDEVFVVNSRGVAFHAALVDEAARSAAIARVTRQLAQEGALTAWRNELYAATPAQDGQVLFHVERAAARYFGIRTYAAHINGLVQAADSAKMWIARRSPTKAIDPGLLDNLVGGGIAAGASVRDTVTKEAWEEAGIPRALARTATAAGAVHIRRDQPDGLHWETIFVHDLWLPESFVPANQDGEVVGQRLVTLDEAARLIAVQGGRDEVTADASLVILDCLWRHCAMAADANRYRALDALQSHALHSLLARPSS